MKRDRDGEPIESEDMRPPVPPHHCDDGWLGMDLEGRPMPCHTCRPWIDERRAALRRKLEVGR